jgi:hypothetical protein
MARGPRPGSLNATQHLALSVLHKAIEDAATRYRDRDDPELDPLEFFHAEHPDLQLWLGAAEIEDTARFLQLAEQRIRELRADLSETAKNRPTAGPVRRGSVVASARAARMSA